MESAADAFGKGNQCGIGGLAEVPEWPHYLVLPAFRCTAFCSFGYSSTERRQLGHLQLRNFGPVFRSRFLEVLRCRSLGFEIASP